LSVKHTCLEVLGGIRFDGKECVFIRTSEESLGTFAFFNEKRVTRKSRNPLILLGCGARI
jgi:hypothetical protein